MAIEHGRVMAGFQKLHLEGVHHDSEVYCGSVNQDLIHESTLFTLCRFEPISSAFQVLASNCKIGIITPLAQA